MALSNQQLAAIFQDIADRLEIRGEVIFKVRAYRNVAENILACPVAVETLWREGRLGEIGGVGKEIAKKIDELMSTGRLAFYERLREQVPDGVVEMLRVPGIGPKRAAEFWQQLGITSLAELEEAAQQGKLRALPRMGEKVEQNILSGLAALKRQASGRLRLGDALPIAEEIVALLRQVAPAQHIAYAGSLRRGKETIGDLDVLAAADDPAPIIRAFVSLPRASEVLAAGDTKASVRLDNGLQVDLRVVPPYTWGTALQYFTGSQQHNIRLREIAQRKGFSLNEYALTRQSDGTAETFADEMALYARLGLAWIPPELREDRGEIERALELGPGRVVMPSLITLRDIRGDLQMHTTWSDGAADVMNMARAAAARGYDYILITDHTAGLGVVNGLTPEHLAQQRKEIDRVNAQLSAEGVKLRVLHGAEVEVRSDGALDLPDEVLAKLDLAQISLHSALNQPRDQITERAIRAMRNPHVHILGHPAGRLIHQREGADYDWEALFRAAADLGVALEINSDPARLDLDDAHARRAAELGCVFTISTDAHHPDALDHMRLGVLVARRAWLTPDRVVNAWPLPRLRRWRRRA
ncbi:MAG: DNA polymerase/3'-5' exonuclease PolX [Thermoflexales bacterium]